MNGRTNAKNGAGAIRDGCAVLEVRALAYSQITAVRADGLTKKQNKGYVDISNSDYWFYYIIIQKFELSNLEWTLTATLESDIISVTVTIDSNKQYNIELTHNLWLIKNNQLVLSVTTTTYANVGQTSNGYKVQHNGSGAAYQGAAYWQLTASVLEGKTFTKLLLDVNDWTGVGNNNYSGFGLASEPSAAGGTMLAFMKAYGNDLTKTLTLDISAYSLVNRYVAIRASEVSHYVFIRNLYLSR